MADFDPIDLGVYYPAHTVPIREAAHAVLSGLVQAQYAYTQSLLDNELLSEDERAELSQSLRDIPSLHDSYQLQQWSWSILRERLVNGSIEAVAVDDGRRSHTINRDFWISEYGNAALSSGVIFPIPLFEPRGEVIVFERDSNGLFREFYDGTYNGLEPPYHKLPSLLNNDISSSIEDYSADRIVRRGAKLKFDVELFLHEAFALIYDANPMPKNQAELGRRATEAYEAKKGRGGRPSDPWVRATVARLWHRLELGQE